ncbi:MAG: hypothetical protein ACQERZ_06995 [Fusobacteriota bacterium]
MTTTLTYRESEDWNLIKENSYSYKVKLNTSFYDGRIAYSGNQSGEKFYTQTDIYGFKSELGYLKDIFKKDSYSWVINLGVGLDKWSRYINSGKVYNKTSGWESSETSEVTGYYEKYTHTYSDISIILKSLNIDGPNYEFEIGTNYPIYILEIVELEKVGYPENVELNPGKEFSPYSRISFLPNDNFKLNLYINSKLLPMSDIDSKTKFFQPKSMQIRYGINFEYMFRD